MLQLFLSSIRSSASDGSFFAPLKGFIVKESKKYFMTSLHFENNVLQQAACVDPSTFERFGKSFGHSSLAPKLLTPLLLGTLSNGVETTREPTSTDPLY